MAMEKDSEFYRVIQAPSPARLAELVHKAKKMHGYEPIGGVAVTYMATRGEFFYQAVAKPPPDPDIQYFAESTDIPDNTPVRW